MVAAGREIHGVSRRFEQHTIRFADIRTVVHDQYGHTLFLGTAGVPGKENLFGEFPYFLMVTSVELC